jgi:hypothetical protein
MKTISNWYEVHADDEVVIAFGPISREAIDSAFDYVESTRLNKHRDKVLKIVAVYLPSGAFYDGLFKLDTEVIHEEHPTVIEA